MSDELVSWQLSLLLLVGLVIFSTVCAPASGSACVQHPEFEDGKAPWHYLSPPVKERVRERAERLREKIETRLNSAREEAKVMRQREQAGEDVSRFAKYRVFEHTIWAVFHAAEAYFNHWENYPEKYQPLFEEGYLPDDLPPNPFDDFRPIEMTNSLDFQPATIIYIPEPPGLNEFFSPTGHNCSDTRRFRHSFEVGFTGTQEVSSLLTERLFMRDGEVVYSPVHQWANKLFPTGTVRAIGPVDKKRIEQLHRQTDDQ